jgi:polyhydroxyalkanoate synthesis regulator phasin
MRALMSPPPADDALPTSLVERVGELVAETGEKLLTVVARLLAPGTTSMKDAARFVRELFLSKEHPPFRAEDVVPA